MGGSGDLDLLVLVEAEGRGRFCRCLRRRSDGWARPTTTIAYSASEALASVPVLRTVSMLIWLVACALLAVSSAASVIAAVAPTGRPH